MLGNRLQYPALLDKIKDHPDPVSALRYLCQTDLFFLLRYGLNRVDMDNDWLFDRCIEVQTSPNNHLDLWAREHYKSTIITFGKTIQDILIDPNITVGIFSHTRPIAKSFLSQIKRELETNRQLQAWFPDILYAEPSKEAIRWSEDAGIIVKRSQNPKESTVEAWGVVDGQPTSKHYTLLVYDDIVTRESVSTPEMMHKTTDALVTSYNLGAIGGARRFIGTRYHFGDTYAAIMERGTVSPRVYPATDDGTLDGASVFMPQKLLDEKRRDFGIYVFSTQMLQNPVADSSQGFKREWVNQYDREPPENCVWYLLVDAANGKRKHNDYTSIWAVGLSSDGNYYCIPEVRDRLNVTERANRVIALHRKYKPIEVRYEEYGSTSDVPYVKEQQEKQQYRFQIVTVGGLIGKTERIRRLIPDFETGKVWLPIRWIVTDYEGKGQDNVRIFIEEELLAFPVTAHEDMLDALARIKETSGKVNGSSIQLMLRWPDSEDNAPVVNTRMIYNPFKFARQKL